MRTRTSLNPASTSSSLLLLSGTLLRVYSLPNYATPSKIILPHYISDPLPGHSSIHTEGELLIIIIKINKKSLKNKKNLYSHFSRYSSEGFRLLSIQLSEQIKTQVKQELAFSNRYKLHLELSNSMSQKSYL